MPHSSTPNPTSILLLKTRSTPNDAYSTLFSPPSNNYTATFIPVLSHRPNASNLSHLHFLLRSNISTVYGGLIFTSQRAVEAFATTLAGGDEQLVELGNLTNLLIPLYVVGPATSRTLIGLRDTHLPKCQVLGQETGNGEKLAHYMLEHYNGLHSHPSSASAPKLPLLFLVGEQRRDIIPKTLMDDHLPEDQRIQVDELVVYETAEMESFPSDFEGAIVEAKDAAREGVVWVVVFSPTGCEAMLKGLGWLDEEKKYKGRSGGDGVFVATIGPTTRDYLLTTFGFEPDVCAEKPSPEGVRDGIEKFIRERGVG